MNTSKQTGRSYKNHSALSCYRCGYPLTNIVQKEVEKILNYQFLLIEIKRMWNVIPVMIGATGYKIPLGSCRKPVYWEQLTSPENMRIAINKTGNSE